MPAEGFPDFEAWAWTIRLETTVLGRGRSLADRAWRSFIPFQSPLPAVSSSSFFGSARLRAARTPPRSRRSRQRRRPVSLARPRPARGCEQRWRSALPARLRRSVAASLACSRPGRHPARRTAKPARLDAAGCDPRSAESLERLGQIPVAGARRTRPHATCSLPGSDSASRSPPDPVVECRLALTQPIRVV